MVHLYEWSLWKVTPPTVVPPAAAQTTVRASLASERPVMGLVAAPVTAPLGRSRRARLMLSAGGVEDDGARVPALVVGVDEAQDELVGPVVGRLGGPALADPQLELGVALVGGVQVGVRGVGAPGAEGVVALGADAAGAVEAGVAGVADAALDLV